MNPSCGPDSLGTGAMFDAIAPRYDLLNRVISVGIDRRWRAQAAAAVALEPNEACLDLATGTADLAIEIAERHPTCNVVGLDPSSRMLAIGRAKVQRARLHDRVGLLIGDAQRLPFKADTFAGCTIAFGIRNVPDRARALREFRRVTRPGGRVVVLELSEPRAGLLAPFARFHVRQVVPRIGGLLSGAREYRYLKNSIANFPQPSEFAEQMEASGLRVLQVQPMTWGACTLYVAEPVKTRKGVE